MKLLKPLKLRLRGAMTKYVPGSAGSVGIQLCSQAVFKTEIYITRALQTGVKEDALPKRW